MNVKIDLRPDKQAKPKVSTVGFSKYIAVLLILAFVVVSGLTLVYGALKSHYMKAEILQTEKSISRLTTQNTRIVEELNRLQGQEKIYTDALKLLQDELPTIEFLSLLEQNLPVGVWLNSINIKRGSVSLKGNAYGENDVVLFARGLLESELVMSVSFPDTRRGKEKDGIPMVDFSFTCQIRDIAQIPTSGILGGAKQ